MSDSPLKSPVSDSDALLKELTQLQTINTSIANLIKMVQLTTENLNQVNHSSSTTEVLLDQWIRILNQTNFTHDVINDPNWLPDNDEDDPSEDLQQKLLTEQKLIAQLESLDSENLRLQSEINQRSSKNAENKLSRDSLRKRELSVKPRLEKKARIVK